MAIKEYTVTLTVRSPNYLSERDIARLVDRLLEFGREMADNRQRIGTCPDDCRVPVKFDIFPSNAVLYDKDDTINKRRKPIDSWN